MVWHQGNSYIKVTKLAWNIEFLIPGSPVIQRLIVSVSNAKC